MQQAIILFPVGRTVVGKALHFFIYVSRIGIKGGVFTYRNTRIYKELSSGAGGRTAYILCIGVFGQKGLYLLQTGGGTVAKVVIVANGIYIARAVGFVLPLKIDGIINKTFAAKIGAAVETGKKRKAVAFVG